jgi:hypothetical protein
MGINQEEQTLKSPSRHTAAYTQAAPAWETTCLDIDRINNQQRTTTAGEPENMVGASGGRSIPRRSRGSRSGSAGTGRGGGCGGAEGGGWALDWRGEREKENEWAGTCRARIWGGRGERATVWGNRFFFTLRSLPFASTIENRAHCQPDKRRRSKCKEFFRPDPTDVLDCLRWKSDGEKRTRPG